MILLLQFCPANRRMDALGLKTSSGLLPVHLVDSPERRLFALGTLTSFSPPSGLLLVFDDGTPPRIWSKALQVQADLLWLDETRQILDRDLDAGPCRADPCPEYAPERGAVSVLILPPGTARDPVFQVGQTAFLQALKPVP